jgi:hypothetical protein
MRKWFLTVACAFFLIGAVAVPSADAQWRRGRGYYYGSPAYSSPAYSYSYYYAPDYGAYYEPSYYYGPSVYYRGGWRGRWR